MTSGKFFICGSALALVTLFGCGRQEQDGAAQDPATEPPHVADATPQTQPALADATTHTFTAQLSGTAGPTEGDADGTGSAQIVIDQASGELCYELSVAGIEPATMAHIHVGGATETGGVVVPLATPDEGESAGCLNPPAEVVAAIVENPEGYYVNVHNQPFPGGAVRGQLTH
ncbi:MAG: CHRD domain-containing protein [Pseudomonadales bacterium]